MAISLDSLRSSRDTRPPRVLIYGVAGVGKTTFAASAEKPVFIWTEEGGGTLDVPGFPLAKSYQDVIDALTALYTEEHDFKTVVLDSVDWLEPLVWQQVCARHEWDSIETPGYGKGYIEALNDWRTILDGFNALRDTKGMGVVLVAHCEIKRFENPETEPYDRYQPKLQHRASALVQEHADVIGFANYRVATQKTDTGFNKTVVRGVGGGERVLYLAERPAFIAKNRYAMPGQVPLDWQVFAQHVPTLNAQNAPNTEQETAHV